MAKASKNPKSSNLPTEMPRVQNTLNNEIKEVTNNIFTHTASVYYNSDIIKNFFSVDKLNQQENLKLCLKKVRKKDNPLTIQCDFSNSTSQTYINYLTHRTFEELLSYAMYKDIPLLVIQNLFIPKTLKVNCIPYQSNYDFTEMLNNYQPAKIIYLQPPMHAVLCEPHILGVYLLDEENNFITKLIIQFVDEKNAPKGCKKLRVPKTVSEFYASY